MDNNGEKRVKLNIEEELAKMQGKKKWGKEKKQAKEPKSSNKNEEAKGNIPRKEETKKEETKKDKWNTRGLITGLFIALMSIIVAVEISYAYSSRYSKEVSINIDLTQAKTDLEKNLEIYKGREEVIQETSVGEKITAQSLRTFDSYFKNDYTIDILDNKGEKVSNIDNIDSKLVYVVFSKGKESGKYHYVFKQIGEIDTTGKPENNKAVGQIGQEELNKAEVKDSVK